MFIDNFQLNILWTASDETVTNKLVNGCGMF